MLSSIPLRGVFSPENFEKHDSEIAVGQNSEGSSSRAALWLGLDVATPIFPQKVAKQIKMENKHHNLVFLSVIDI